MNINFILNGEDVAIDVEAEQRLIDILRLSLNLAGAKTGCYTGRCGLCSVILNNEVVKSCLVPAFKIGGCEIVTIEGLSQTDEYQDIVHGLDSAGIENCGYCDAGKILTIEALLAKNPSPGSRDILTALKGIKCRCTEPESLIEGVQLIAENRQRRLYGRRF
jgi:carbon-monoxide dehydrogenase small subunit